MVPSELTTQLSVLSCGCLSASCARGTLLPLTLVSHELRMLITGLVGLLPVEGSARGASVVGSTLVAMTSVRPGTCWPTSGPACPAWSALGAPGAHAATAKTRASIGTVRSGLTV